MDAFFIIEMIVGVAILAVVFKFAYGISRKMNKKLGLGYGEPAEVRPATDREVALYESVNKDAHDDLWVNEGYMPQAYGENKQDTKRRAAIAAVSGGNHYAGLITVNINGKNHEIAREDIYYMMDDYLAEGSKLSVIWEKYEGEYHFRYVIPEIYL